jgi:poly(A) polymerase/tRNA nucleotidyltransferase (CCA-adding enzyme)
MEKPLDNGTRRRLEETLPRGARYIQNRIRRAGGRVVLVGGCLRDLLLGRPIHDWDLATDRTPREVRRILPRALPAGQRFGTLLVPMPDGLYEITTFRRETGYSDHRHPDEVEFTRDLGEDLARRDFTVNAMAWDPERPQVLVDPYGGKEDLEGRLIRAVGDPRRRFAEDALRILRAVRLAAQLGFRIDPATLEAAREMAPTIEHLSWERIREELNKLLAAPKPSQGLRQLLEIRVLERILPELVACAGVTQNEWHAYDVLEHTLAVTDEAPADNLIVRLAALFHDLGKPETRTEEGGQVHFYGHQFVSARKADAIMRRLRYSNEERERVCHLVRNHMFFYEPEWSDGAVRRFLRQVGPENVPDLFALRRADTAGSGKKGADASSHLEALTRRIHDVMSKEHALSVKDLALDGHDVMSILGIPPGPMVGEALRHLLEYVLDEPERNTREALVEELRRWAAEREGESSGAPR